MSLDLLIIKTSSLGDVVHALPVLSDVQQHHPDWKVGWVVEEQFAALPLLHPFCQRVVPVAMRRWRKRFPSLATCREWSQYKKQVKALEPARVLDLQGLMKSAWLALQCPGQRLGYEWGSARENLATLAYQHKVAVPWNVHAVSRNRALAAWHLGYQPDAEVRYGITRPSKVSPGAAIFLHSTSRTDKLWPEARWMGLGFALAGRGWKVELPSGNSEEYARSLRLAAAIPGAQALPPASLQTVIGELSKADVVVGVDTGLTHLATALGVPTLALYGATDPDATGVFGSPVAVNLGGIGRSPSEAEVLSALERLLPEGR